MTDTHHLKPNTSSFFFLFFCRHKTVNFFSPLVGTYKHKQTLALLSIFGQPNSARSSRAIDTAVFQCDPETLTALKWLGERV